MIKLEWVCDKCGNIDTYESVSNYLLDISEMIGLKCKKCKTIFELIMRYCQNKTRVC